jgi:F-type H+-transporting ATPase subunit h
LRSSTDVLPTSRNPHTSPSAITHTLLSTTLPFTNPQSKDATASIRSFTAPQPPKAPELPSDLAAELSAFDAQEPVLGQSASPAKAAAADAAAAAEGGEGVQEYLAFLEKDLPKADKHH